MGIVDPSFGLKIRARRRLLDLSGAVLAERATEVLRSRGSLKRVSKSYISQLETGKTVKPDGMKLAAIKTVLSAAERGCAHKWVTSEFSAPSLGLSFGKKRSCSKCGRVVAGKDI